MKRISVALLYISIIFYLLTGCIKTELSIQDYEDIVIGTSQEELHKKFGEPQGMLSGMYGDVYILDKKRIIIYYKLNENKEVLVNEVKITDVEEASLKKSANGDAFLLHSVPQLSFVTLHLMRK